LNATCSFNAPDREITGKCVTVLSEVLACVP
jgi:hypothetical protein